MLSFKFTPSRILVCLVLVMVTLIIIFTDFNLAKRKAEAVFQRNLKLPRLVKNSLVIKTEENPASRRVETYKSGYRFHNHRLRLWYGGRCIDSSDGKKLTVQFCDPDLKQVRFGDKCLGLKGGIF